MSTSYSFRRRGPVLTPNTAQQIIERFSHPMPDMNTEMYVDLIPSSSTQSPDSLYSHTSPIIDPFEYDHEHDYEEHDVEEFDAMMNDDEHEDQEEVSEGRASPAWGHWPQTTSLGGPGWTPLPTMTGGRHGSIISISPRGSYSGGAGAMRRVSTPNSKLSTSSTSNPYLSELRRREKDSGRRSSAVSTRRRSSVFSNGSVADPVEADKLRKFASMSQLARRFSELVQVVSPLVGSQEEEFQSRRNDIDQVREMISTWSPYSTDTADSSEIVTAPYVPSPARPSIPALLSNFPLDSVARSSPRGSDTPNSLYRFGSIDSNSSQSDLYRPAIPLPFEPDEERRMERRPNLARLPPSYEFPTRSPLLQSSTEDARPSIRRAVSTPYLPSESSDASVPAKLITPINRPIGSFPVARSQPLGLSRLRETTGPSLATESRRPSLVAERRMSIVEHGSRRPSASRKPVGGLAPMPIPRKGSIESRRGSSPRKSSSLLAVSLDRSRKSSTGSRQSSVVSLGEYQYLATQITPKAPAVEENINKAIYPTNDTLRSRRNAPPAIVLPPYEFPAKQSRSPGTASTVRYNPLDSFFGRPTPSLSDSSSPSASIDPLSPGSDILKSPLSPGASVLDRGRPVSSPNSAYSFPRRDLSQTQSTGKERISPDVIVGGSAMRSPSYRFPNLPEGSGLLSPYFERERFVDDYPVKSEAARNALQQIPLKSILIHTTADSLTSPAPSPQPRSAVVRQSLKDIRDIDAAPGGAQPMDRKIEVVRDNRQKPGLPRQSSFTRLFHRAKAQVGSQSPAK